MFHSIEYLKNYGFSGFVKISELWTNASIIPKQQGVYVVLNYNSNEFLERGNGGFFKGVDPNVCISELERKWVKDTIIVYIGKAGGNGVAATLQSRLKQYLDFGKGKPVGHRGGRYIWQLKDNSQLVIAWKTLTNEEPVIIERQLLNMFTDYHGCLPFANLV